MGTRIYTDATCDRCGAAAVREGAWAETPPDDWVVLTMVRQVLGNNRQRITKTLCPACADAIEAMVTSKAVSG